jgi:hypothetical protein
MVKGSRSCGVASITIEPIRGSARNSCSSINIEAYDLVAFERERVGEVGGASEG